MNTPNDNSKAQPGPAADKPSILTAKVKMSFGPGEELPEEFVLMSDSADQIRAGGLVIGDDSGSGMNAERCMSEQLRAQLAKLDQLPHRQDATVDQLRDLQAFAVKLGLYDAADVIKTLIAKK